LLFFFCLFLFLFFPSSPYVFGVKKSRVFFFGEEVAEITENER